MRKLNSITENCVLTPSSCVEWNGGDVAFLGICNGDYLNTLVWEMIKKLQELAEEDLSTFDIDALLDICNQKAPTEVTIISILTLVKNNQVCLKDYLDNLNEQLGNILQDQAIDVNLKCYEQFDNLGNSLNITRNQLDQLIIDNLCLHEGRLDSLEGKVTNLQSQINGMNNTSTVEELTFATCVDGATKPTSSQVIAVANDVCAQKTATGTAGSISTALSKAHSSWNTKFGLLPGWDTTPANLAESYGNALLIIQNLASRIELMELNCCAVTCKDVELGFSATLNEDMDGIIIRFNSGTGTFIPNGMSDLGSTGTIKDMDGNIVSFNIVISNNSETEVATTGLNLNGDLIVNITAIIGTEGLQCQKCLMKTVKLPGCGYCELTAVGTGKVIIVYTVPDNIVST